MKNCIGFINTILYDEDFKNQQKRALRRERLKEELKKEFEEIFDAE